LRGNERRGFVAAAFAISLARGALHRCSKANSMDHMRDGRGKRRSVADNNDRLFAFREVRYADL
jgi:hypothetical protein